MGELCRNGKPYANAIVTLLHFEFGHLGFRDQIDQFANLV